ncbi:MAG TPA: twin-arginine translocation signal domain-containing protein, partial [Verrucomicrobiae bacterium]|nr:twin-arginine translocation signal domain-containing protein [Verrucomicrobiae bacterium]
MNWRRRDFLKASGALSAGAALGVWPSATEAAMEVNKGELAGVAISLAKKLGASYADIRINRYLHESISTREERVL